MAEAQNPENTRYATTAKNGKSWRQYAQECTDQELLGIIRSTNPNGWLALARVAAMDEWDRRFPVGSDRAAARQANALYRAITGVP